MTRSSFAKKVGCERDLQKLPVVLQRKRDGGVKASEDDIPAKNAIANADTGRRRSVVMIVIEITLVSEFYLFLVL